MSETRKAKRKLLSVKIRYKSANVDEFVEHYSKDISKGGVFIKTNKPLAIGTLLKFEFQLRDQSSVIRGVGRVAWKRDETNETPQSPSGMGVKFVKMDSESRGVVHKIVDGREGVPGTFDRFSEPEPEPEPEDDDFGFFSSRPPGAPASNNDVTVVRDAGQFLESAMIEGHAEPTAAQEAEAIGSSARQRSLEIDAQRRAAASADPRREVERMRNSNLPMNFADDIATAVGAGAFDARASVPVDLDFRTLPPSSSIADDLINEIEGNGQAAVFSKTSEVPTNQAVAAAPSANVQDDKKKLSPIVLALGGLILVGAAFGGWWMMRGDETPTLAVQTDVVQSPAPKVPVAPPEEATPEATPTEGLAVPTEDEVTEGEEEVSNTVEEVADVETVADSPSQSTVKPARRAAKIAPVTIKKKKTALRATKAAAASEPEKVTSVYVVEFNTEPEGARVTMGGKVIQSTPGVLEFSSMPVARSASISKRGFKRVVKRVRRANFVEERKGYNVLLLTLDLKPVAKAAPKVAPKPEPKEATPVEATPVEAAPKPEEKPSSPDDDIDWS